ncbi:MAG: DinB family protein [Bryobacteraceae bacterium]
MTATSTETVISSQALLDHWQSHRRLTRRVIEAFPEDKLFTFSVGSMRPFSEMVIEFLKMAEPIVKGVATGKWVSKEDLGPTQTRADLLRLWDQDTATINAIWPTIPPYRFSEVDKAFDQWEGTGINTILYGIENEIHHRGQGYVYLRVLGINPPAFYDRS